MARINDLEAAWAELLGAMPPGWFVGRPSYHDAYRQWMLYALDPSRKPSSACVSASEAVGDSELAVVREVDRCLALVKDGKLPKQRLANLHHSAWISKA